MTYWMLDRQTFTIIIQRTYPDWKSGKVVFLRGFSYLSIGDIWPIHKDWVEISEEEVLIYKLSQ
jgi:hypothetical protein